MVDCFLGEIRMFAGWFSPVDWIFCNGQELSTTQNQALFSLIGTIYGGDGKRVFKLPDLRGRIPVGQGANTSTIPPLSARTIGESGGEEVHTLTTAEMPAHSHLFIADKQAADSKSPGSTKVFGTVRPNATNYGLYGKAPLPTDPTPAAVTQFDVLAVTAEGGGQVHSNIMPTVALNYIMAMRGSYPPRP